MLVIVVVVRPVFYSCDLQVTLHQITWLPGQSSRCSVKFIRSKCNEGCDRCIYVTVVTCADTYIYPMH